MTRTRRIWRRVGLIATWCLGGLAVFLVVAVVALYTLADVPRPEDLPQPQAGEIFYADGTPMAKIGTENRTNVPLSQVPMSMRWAVISTEDRNFYNDPGFSFTGTARAALSDLTGGDTQGGSGITQQYVKNAYLSSAQTITRKIKELAISVKLAREYSKDDILEFYLNTVYFGRGAYGIEAAAQTWFNEDVSKLTVAQSALLAGLLKAPSGYDPALHPVAAHARWKLVLDNMVTTKHLTGEEEAALTYPATQPATDGNGLGATGPENLIVNQVTAELEADGMSESEINTKGLRITTTIVPAAQQDAEKAIATAYANPTAKQANLHQALVAIDPSSGAVIAYDGNSDGSGIDYAQAYRQPGSSFKPYVLATALQQNLDGIETGLHDRLGVRRLVAAGHRRPVDLERPDRPEDRQVHLGAGDDLVAQYRFLPAGLRRQTRRGGDDGAFAGNRRDRRRRQQRRPRADARDQRGDRRPHRHRWL